MQSTGPLNKRSNFWIIAGIVVVIIIIVLLALNQEGFSIIPPGFGLPPMPSGVTCLPESGFGCTHFLLYNGTFTATVSQDTGTTWTHSNIFYVISGSPTPTSVPPLPCEEGISTAIMSGQAFNVSLNSYSNSSTCAGMPTKIGQVLAGTLWAGYQTSQNGTEQIVQIALVDTKAT